MPFDFSGEGQHPAESMNGPVISAQTRIRLADFSDPSGPHRFGGPLRLDFVHSKGKLPPLQRVLTLSQRDPNLGSAIPGVTELPLVYGFTLNGCRLRYKLVADGQVELLELNPSVPTSGWPYKNYPAAFPEKRFALLDDGQIEPDEVDQLTWQNLEGIDPEKGVVVIVPPSSQYGVSLWATETTS